MTWCLHGTGPANSRNTEKSGVPQVSVKCKKWIWSGCTAAMCLKRVQSPHGNDSNGNNNGEVREEKENPGAFFWAHELRDYLTLPDCTRGPDWPRWHVFILASAGGWLMDDGCQSIPRPWLNAYSHTLSLRGKSERERYLWESTCYIHSRFSPHFWGFLCCARFQKEVYCLCDQLLLSPWDWVRLGGWADWQMALFFLVFSFFPYRRLVREEDVLTTTTTTTIMWLG